MSVETPVPSAPLFFSYSPRTQLTLHSALGFSEFFAAIIPPAYLVSALVMRRRMFSVRGLMYNSIGGVVTGAGIGAGYGYLRGVRDDDFGVRVRVEKLALDEAQVRRNDYATIGAVLSALLAPAMFLKKAPLPLLALGGASMGLGVGATSFVIEKLTKKEKTGVVMPGETTGGKSV